MAELFGGGNTDAASVTGGEKKEICNSHKCV